MLDGTVVDYPLCDQPVFRRGWTDQFELHTLQLRCAVSQTLNINPVPYSPDVRDPIGGRRHLLRRLPQSVVVKATRRIFKQSSAHCVPYQDRPPLNPVLVSPDYAIQQVLT